MTSTAATDFLQETAVVYPGSYNSANLNLSSLMVQNSGGGVNNWVGPMPVNMMHPITNSTAITPAMCDVINWSTNIDWLFYPATGAAVTNKIGMYIINRTTGTAAWQGFITATFPAATNHTVRDFRALYYTYSTGTVAVSGTAVTGSSTAWQTARFASGARIGFGSTNPTTITTWYPISAIGSDTTITLVSSAGTVSGGTSFVIEEVRLAIATTNATTTNGGLQLIKGLCPNTFIGGGTTISAAVSTDNVQAVYWLKDAATNIETTLCGLATTTTGSSNTSHLAYCLQGGGTASASIYEFNMRASLTLTSGADTADAFQLATGVQTLTANLTPQKAMILATMQSGTGSGVSSLYLLDVTHIYRAPVSSIVSSSTSFCTDNVLVTQAGSALQMGVLTTGSSIGYNSIIDRLTVDLEAATTTLYGLIVMPYLSGSGIIDNYCLICDNQSQTAASTSYVPHPIAATALETPSTHTECAGFTYIVPSSATDGIGNIWGWPTGADFNYNTLSAQEIITPSISTTGCTQFNNLFVNEVLYIGDAYYGYSLEPYAVYARTSGISGDSGSWTQIGSNGDLSSFGAANAIQFKFTFRTLGRQCIPTRINNLCVTYQTSANINANLEWNINNSNTSNGTIGWNQISTFGHTPAYTISYYNESTSALVLTDTSAANAYGQFEYWTGSSWVNGVAADAIGSQARYVPSSSLPSGVNVYVQLSAV